MVLPASLWEERLRPRWIKPGEGLRSIASMLSRRLDTPRLMLAATTVEHGAGLWEATARSMPELVATMSWAPTASLDGSRSFAAQMERRWNDQTDWTFTIFHDDEAVGTISLMRYQALFALCEIGYWIRSDLAGRGLMTEAAAAVCDFGFGEIDVHRIELRAAVDNAASQRVAEKLGFTREGLLREAGWVAAGYQDMHLFGLLASERAWA